MSVGRTTTDLRWALVPALAGVVCLAFALIWLHLSPEIVLVIVFGAATLVALIVNPLIGVHTFLMLLYFENAARTSEGVTAMQVLGPLIMVAWFLSLLLKRRAAPRFDPSLVVVVAFVAWCGLSLVYATDIDLAITRFTTFVQLGVAALMFASVLDTPRRLRQALWAIVIWTSVATVIGMIIYGLGQRDVVAGPAENRNAFALYLDIAIISAVFLFQQARSRLAMLSVMLGFLPLFLVGLALTLSRSGWISLLVGIVLVWAHLASERRFWPTLAMIAVFGLLVPFLPDAFWHRAESILPSVKERGETFGQRVDLWSLGLKMVQDHPVLGVGIGNFRSVTSRYAEGEMLAEGLTAHNAYISVAAETGLVGLALFLLLHALALRSARSAIRLGSSLGLPELRVCGVIVEVNILVVMVMALSGSGEGNKVLWVLFGMAMSLGTFATRLGTRTPAASSSGLPEPAAVPT